MGDLPIGSLIAWQPLRLADDRDCVGANETSHACLGSLRAFCLTPQHRNRKAAGAGLPVYAGGIRQDQGDRGQGGRRDEMGDWMVAGRSEWVRLAESVRRDQQPRSLWLKQPD